MIHFLFGTIVLFSVVFCHVEGKFCYVPSGDPISCSCCVGMIGCPPTFRTKERWPQHHQASSSSCDDEPSICCFKSDDKSQLQIENQFKSDEPGYKSFQKCAEYSKQISTYTVEPGEDSSCEFELPVIIGGTPAKARQFPHMAALRSEDSIYICGGSLISERFILTAAHCLGRAAYARLGVLNLTDDLHAQDIKIKQRIRYPTFQYSSHYNDIGLLELETPVELNAYVRPACLALKSSRYTRSNADATGWGLLGPQGSPQSIQMLMKVPLVLRLETECEEAFKVAKENMLVDGILSDSQMCAGSFGQDTCEGDSGGPLQVKSDMKCMYEVIGITSFGNPCGGKKPGVYTRVWYYLRWIEDIVWKD